MRQRGPHIMNERKQKTTNKHIKKLVKPAKHQA